MGHQIILASEDQVVDDVRLACTNLSIDVPLSQSFGVAIFNAKWPRLKALTMAHGTFGLHFINNANFPSLVRCEIGGKHVTFSTPSARGHYPILRRVIEANRRRNEKKIELFLCLKNLNVNKDVIPLICEAVPHDLVPLPPDPSPEVLDKLAEFETQRAIIINNYKSRKSTYPNKELRAGLKILYKAKLKSLEVAERVFREEVDKNLQHIRVLRPPKRICIRFPK